MKYCQECGKMTEGEPLYCQSCGRSYDVRLCPHKHENPREAEFCSQCGSSDLSTPAPKIPASWQLAAILVRIGLGLLLFYTSLKLLEALLLNPAFQQILILFGFILAGLWILWDKLPEWMQDALRSLWHKEHGDD